MKAILSKLILPLFIVSSLTLVGCASSTKKGGADGEGGEGSTSLDLNGDSDSAKAGGLRTVYFDFDSSSLSGDARSTLENNAQVLKDSEGLEVQVEGHCDERGGVQYNLALGERRANAVKEFLVSQGVASKRISTVSYGKERPVEFGHDEGAWSKNRRGNFVVTAK